MHNTASGKRGWKKNQPGHPAGTFSCILITWGNSNFSLFSTSGRQLQHIRSLSVRLWSCLHCQCHMGSRQTSSGPPLKPTTAACLRGFLARPHPPNPGRFRQIWRTKSGGGWISGVGVRVTGTSKESSICSLVLHPRRLTIKFFFFGGCFDVKSK